MINFLKNLFNKNSSEKKGCCGGGCKSETVEINFQVEDADIQILQNLDEKIIVGQIVSVEAHPDPKMTKVKVTKCIIDGGETATILCGGTNVTAGIIVPIATVGTQLTPDFQIGEREIRGVVSRGMICARAELGISTGEEKKGEIWILDPNAKMLIGQSFIDIFASNA